MAVVHSAAWPKAHLAQSSVPLRVTSFFALSWAKTAAANRTTVKQTERDANVFMVGPPEKRVVIRERRTALLLTAVVEDASINEKRDDRDSAWHLRYFIH